MGRVLRDAEGWGIVWWDFRGWGSVWWGAGCYRRVWWEDEGLEKGMSGCLRLEWSVVEC